MANRISHICFADDDPDDHEIFQNVINQLSPAITISSFFRCDALVEFLNDETKSLPDIIFLDYNMPGNDGNECLQAIKKTARLLHIPVIMYSTSDHKKFIEEAYKHGAYKYIVKPSDYAEVKVVLNQLLTDFEQAG